MDTIKVILSGDEVVIRLLDKKLIKCDRVAQIATEMGRVLNENLGRNLIIDLAEVEFMASSMINELIALKKRCDANATRLLLHHTDPNISALLQSIGFGDDGAEPTGKKTPSPPKPPGNHDAAKIPT